MADKAKEPKDKMGALMRLLQYLVETQLEFDRSKCHGVLKKLYALRGQVDKTLQEYFDEYPQERHPATGARGNRTGVFMRNLRELRKYEDQYYALRTKDNLEKMWPFRKAVDQGIQDYFTQFPLQKPEAKAVQSGLF